DAIDRETGNVLRTLYEGSNVAERKIFEFDYNQSEAKQIMIEARHTSNSGQSLKSQLLFDIDRTEEVPTSITPSADLGFETQLSPTRGKGEFKIQADFKSAATVRVLIMDLNGKLVETLHSGPVLEGTNIFTGNSSAWASGTYIASIQNGKSVWTQKMIVH